MQIDFYCPRWGSEDVSWPRFAQRVKQDGFAGVEVFPLADSPKNTDMLQSLGDAGLSYILLHAELQEGKDFNRYVDALTRNLYTLLEYQTAAGKPEFIVSQTGREYYTRAQMEICFAVCDRISRESSVRIIHETHRNKWSFAAHIVQEYLTAFPSLELALDLSHWVCVSESYLEDQADAVELAIRHSRHLHARVGFPEGPQVTDPRAPENQEALRHHLAWWDQWIHHLIQTGSQRATITPEFGPYPYMAFLPFTRQPLSPQYEINCWMKDLLETRYAGMMKGEGSPEPAK
ncbi:sugar phosphate isomerase/epimerase [Chitinophaga sp. XS-30]|uniref:sugar phosphate isomerase/epimerase n=1 Tax=Chitinophaga sp. XS-30 TaxID=2604421 RepID=UPI0011DD6D90|nr:sugar phosphate isomerase/epimerase [Chitinophaga sp. XS-30]QEH41777.1 sugar phosphate isomerase/epimerase [Chitinophaga sp. XS-30]